MNLTKYKQNALSKRRQNSSYKPAKNEFSTISDMVSPEHKTDCEQVMSNHEKSRQKHGNTTYDFNKHISDKFHQKQAEGNDKVSKGADLIELVNSKDDNIVTCKTKIEQNEEPESAEISGKLIFP